MAFFTQAKRFNKATASVIAGAVVTVIGSYVAWDNETLGAVQTLLTTALVFLIPNKGE